MRKVLSVVLFIFAGLSALLLLCGLSEAPGGAMPIGGLEIYAGGLGFFLFALLGTVAWPWGEKEKA